MYRPNLTLQHLPNRPTRADAREASDRLNYLLRQFPFATGFDWSVWLAGLLTAIQRPRIAGPVPGFVFNGNKAGIGKGLLIDAIGVLAWGHCIPTRTYPTDPVEAGKVKLSLALSAVSAVHFDNLPEGGFFGNSELDSALTSTQVGGRILGQSRESGPVPLRPCWFLSGNNVSPSKDAYRRWLPCNLRMDLESPHERNDIEEQDLLGSIHDRRPELLRNALIILKAHAIAGHPREAWPRIGSFEEWDVIVRAPSGMRPATIACTPSVRPRRSRRNGSTSWPSSRDGPSSRTGPIGASRSRMPCCSSRGTLALTPCSTPHSCGCPRTGRCQPSNRSATESGP